MRFKDHLRSARRRALAPFNRFERRLKKAAERFVVKTVSKHGLPTYETSNASSAESTASQSMGVIHANPNGATNLMLAFLKASQRTTVSMHQGLEAISLGDGRLLVTHPTSGFMYASASNVKLVPQLILKTYQEQATIAIERDLNDGDCVIHFGAGQGYHTLSIADAIGEKGRVLAVESEPTELTILRMNIEAHSLDDRVQVCELSNDQPLTLATLLQNIPSISAIYASPDFEMPEAWMRGLSDLLQRSTDTIFIVGNKRQTFEDFASTRQLSNLATERRAA